MPNPQKQERIEWPGDWVFYQNWLYHSGLSSDSSGNDAINLWASTATPEEFEFQKKRAYSYGWFIGYAAGYAAVSAIWKALFGND